MRTKIIVASGAIVTLAFALSACAAEAPAAPPPGSTDAAASQPAASETASAEWANPNAPDEFKFMATDLVTGEVVDGTTLVGQDTVLWFWASWCPVCAAESGVFVRAEAEGAYPEGTRFLGIAGLSDATAAEGFVAEHGMEQFSHVYDEDGSIWRNFGVTSQPTMILINEQGETQTYVGGYGYYDVVEKIAWLGES